MRFFHPQIHLLISDDGTSGYCATSEIPLFYYTVALLYKFFGAHEFLIRLINTLIFLSGLLYLFRLLYRLLKDSFWASSLAILLFTSPLLVYYASNYLTNASALALGIIGFYHFYSYCENKRVSYLYYSALFYLLAGSFKITGLFMVFPILGYLILKWMGWTQGKQNSENALKVGIAQILPFIVLLIIVSGWVIYARFYNNLHNTTHFSTTIFPIWNYDLEGIRGIVEGIRKLWLPSYFNKFTILIIILLGLSIPFNMRYINPLLSALTILLLPLLIIYILLQFWTFRDHDYYVINMYILIVMIIAASISGLLNRFPQIFKSYLLKGLFAGFLLLNIVYARQEYDKRHTGWMNENSEYLAFREMKEKLFEFGIHPDDTVICLPGTSQQSLYLIDMDGWTAYVDARFGRDKPIFYNHDSIGIRKSIDNGARYLFVLGIEEIYQKPFLMDFTKALVGHHENILVFDLLFKNMNIDINARRLKLELSSDMENLSADNKFFITSEDSVFLDFGRSQSTEISFGGKYSSKLSDRQAFSLTSVFDKVATGESFRISAWVYDPGDQCRIIASADDPNLFYYSKRTIETEDSLGWRNIQIDFFVPEKIHDLPLKVYLHYSGTDSAYVDDFVIQYFEKNEIEWLLRSVS
ncbi:MAG TPA: hypothetical protein ENI20_05075 [Bacteroides sp.]|nr:hypothetical protein [Bacteroides sp.]